MVRGVRRKVEGVEIKPYVLWQPPSPAAREDERAQR
jgi:hypothetical protein